MIIAARLDVLGLFGCAWDLAAQLRPAADVRRHLPDARVVLGVPLVPYPSAALLLARRLGAGVMIRG